MRLLFVSGDVGGARAIIPVVDIALARDIRVGVVRHGHIGREGPEDWPWIEVEDMSPASIVEHSKPDAIIFATSVDDRLALEIASAGGQNGIRTVHVLDNWTTYAKRLIGKDGAQYMPDVYAVMDDLAYRQAVSHDIPARVLAVTGQPALANLAAERRRYNDNDGTGGLRHVLFVSEPALGDQGGPGSPTYRGYTEVDVLEGFCQTAQGFAEQTEVLIAPHPREDRDFVEANWSRFRNSLHGRIIGPDEVRKVLHTCWGVAGMTSILLYEGWLLAKPVISLQPGLSVPGLEAIGEREGVVFVDRRENLSPALKGWLKSCEGCQSGAGELERHVNAAAEVLRLAAFSGEKK